MRRTLAPLLLAFTLGGLFTQPADARKDKSLPSLQLDVDSFDRGGRYSREDRDEPRRSDPREAARRAQDANGGGRVLSVEPVSGGHRVKLLKNGEVRVVFIPD